MLRTRKHVVGPAGVEVQLVAEPQQKGVGRPNGIVVFAAQHPAIPQLGEVGNAPAGEPDPANQLQIAERTLRPLDIGLQQEDGLAVTPPLLVAAPFDGSQQAETAPMDPLPETVHEALEDRRRSREQP